MNPVSIVTEPMKLNFPLFNTTIHVPVDEPVSGRKSRRFFRKKAEEKKLEEAAKAEAEQVQSVVESVDEQQEQQSVTADSKPIVQPLLMVEVVNVTHEKFRQTEEIKVCERKDIHFFFKAKFKLYQSTFVFSGFDSRTDKNDTRYYKHESSVS